ncbi:hypothetical protein MMC16_001637 [Acarospora aff. strigata]|nr:hypothetical protein [Acarospora aff. strigata]
MMNSQITLDYLLGLPKGDYKATIFLIHGWPDLSIGWRYQIPVLLGMGLRVVCPDIMGFGGTDAPQVPPEDISYYGYKRAAGDIKELARQLGASRIILGGHDWGGAIVYRVALWYPDFVTHLFAVCTPYWVPTKDSKPLEELVKTRLPNFTYQLQLASGEIEKHIQSKEEIKQFLNALYGGRGPNGEVGFIPEQGVLLENLPKLKPGRLLSEKELDYYADEYARNGMHGTINWYRNREVNHKEELSLEKTTIDIPVLFIQATRDGALPPPMSVNMDKSIPDLTRKEVETNHWALWEAPEQVNGIIKECAGVTGLQTALFLLEASYRVTIVAKHLPGDLDLDYASPWAGAHWRTHAARHEEEICGWDRETYEYWRRLIAKEGVGEQAGLKLYTSRYYWDEPTDEITNGASSLWWRDVVLDFAVIRPRDLPAGVHYGVTFTSFCINTPRYLKYLLNAFTDAGGTVLRRELSVDKGFSAALAAAEDVVSGEGGGGEAHAFVNATGLGARLLLGEDKMFPTRGQTVLVRGEAEVARTRVGTGYITYCIPRPGSGTTILGGTKEVGDWNGHVDEETTRSILSRAKVLAPELLNADGDFHFVGAQVGFRPSREGGPRVELEEIDGKSVVHSYGHSGAG